MGPLKVRDTWVRAPGSCASSPPAGEVAVTEDVPGSGLGFTGAGGSSPQADRASRQEDSTVDSRGARRIVGNSSGG
ncbi:hypothetical protein ACN28S_54105 [Cystobacter fuscus]